MGVKSNSVAILSAISPDLKRSFNSVHSSQRVNNLCKSEAGAVSVVLTKILTAATKDCCSLLLQLGC